MMLFIFLFLIFISSYLSPTVFICNTSLMFKETHILYIPLGINKHTMYKNYTHSFTSNTLLNMSDHLLHYSTFD